MFMMHKKKNPIYLQLYFSFFSSGVFMWAIFFFGCLSRMTTLITMTMEGTDRIERRREWIQEKPRFSVHNLLHISITMQGSQSAWWNHLNEREWGRRAHLQPANTLLQQNWWAERGDSDILPLFPAVGNQRLRDSNPSSTITGLLSEIGHTCCTTEQR